MDNKIRELKLDIHPSMGILEIEHLELLDSSAKLKILCASVLREEIDHNLLSLLCCNPKYLFFPMVPVALVLCPFAFVFSWGLGLMFLCLAPLALLFTFLGLQLRRWMVNRCISRARTRIIQLTEGAISCEISFKFFSDDDSKGGSQMGFGNYVQIVSHRGATAEDLSTQYDDYTHACSKHEASMETTHETICKPNVETQAQTPANELERELRRA